MYIVSSECPPPLSQQFFIKDTKSSNGTFVNENRLSPSGVESGLVELRSRDTVQFGVNVNVEKQGVLAQEEVGGTDLDNCIKPYHKSVARFCVFKIVQIICSQTSTLIY